MYKNGNQGIVNLQERVFKRKKNKTPPKISTFAAKIKY
jgi:hypothetical protein